MNKDGAEPSKAPATPTLSRTACLRRWTALLGLSVAAALLLGLAGFSAAVLVGAMIAAIAMAVRGKDLKVPPPLFAAAQAVVGCLVASLITPATLAAAGQDWPIFTLVTGATLLASGGLGYSLSRWKILPGTAAIWGSVPGASSAMVLMAEAYGADARLVALMTYTRVMCVALLASILAFALTGRAHAAPLANWLSGGDLLSLAEVMVVALAGLAIGKAARIPAAPFLGPVLLGVALNSYGVVDLTLPRWLMTASFAVIGWRIGLTFTREIISVAAKATPSILLAVLFLVGFCGLLAVLLNRLAGIDPVTAFLATSPGGIDSVAIIAASTPVNVSFVMALQTFRMLVILILGPPLGRFLARNALAA